ncbi:cyanophycinase [Azohydromonas aeria]|uniref:cyanophycinase n=1 Tax=Azohydromonas aeria TaxID=2590212 RepID=UPI0012F8FF85|nr:cyanophycinase [Azohydromonas aeria]
MSRIPLDGLSQLLWRGAAAAALALAAVLPAQAAGGVAGSGAKPTVSAKTYDYYLSGNAADMPAPVPSSQLLVLMGGGSDVDEAFQQMIAKARGALGGKVDVVVLRTSGADGYNPYLVAMDGVDSVETLVLNKPEAANDPQVNRIVAGADVLFIAGGDQSTYIANWTGTQLQRTIASLLARRQVPFGGTSAGLAVLGDVDYTGENGSVTSAQALSNPYDRRVTLSTAFLTGLPGLQATVTDSHVRTRDRMGRLVTFLARMVRDGLTTLAATRGIGVDEATAVLVDSGRATVVGANAAYFLRPTIAPAVVAARMPLDFRTVQVYKVPAAVMAAQAAKFFDLGQWTPSDHAAPYYYDALGGALTSTQEGGSVY